MNEYELGDRQILTIFALTLTGLIGLLAFAITFA